MSTISFSVDEQTKRTIRAWAKRGKKSQSAVLKDLVKIREFDEALDRMQTMMAPKLVELGLETEDDIYAYLESNDTYEERKAKVAALKNKTA